MRTNRRYADLGEHQNLLGLAGLHDRDEDVLIAQIESVYKRDRQRVETLTLTEYVDFLSDVPLPSAQQRNEFAEFVSTAHSWYKHLPTNLPGQDRKSVV